MRLSILTAALAFAAAGCATSGGFDKLYPGMSSQQVVEAMGSGPSRAQEFPDKSTAWYYGEDRCVLMREDKVVTKATTEENTTVDAKVITLRDTTKAMCAPAEYATTPKREQQLDTPFGTIKGDLDPSAAVKKVKGVVTGEQEQPEKTEQATTPAP
ncbi:outer membrane protein assembly factor BamE [Pyxidicoccus xibeiensis]|uniref:outer membrane protein assembly factor BamE n=1 Tax=Pyxidicoccus xibeiensis TaxID=2906759 RepID=UPI0020A7E150|nr:outer membrane protein assembly factor BamE [Pyxidicoccus xibeiensis]MCP3137503.1 outer membrane protein assembly factor BamE [Pyxidicoccus xibeiensis]